MSCAPVDDITMDDNEIMNMINELTTNPEKVEELNDEQLAAIEKRINPYGCISGLGEKFTVLSITNYKKVFLERLLMTSMVAFMHRMASEWEVDLDDLVNPPNKEEFTRTIHNPDKDNAQLMSNLFEQALNEERAKAVIEDEHKSDESETIVFTEEEELAFHANATAKVNELVCDRVVTDTQAFVEEQEKRVREQSANEREVITRWLSTFFKFDPLKHAKSSFDKEMASVDPERQQPPPPPFDTVLPADVFAQFENFYSVNFDGLRNATQYLFCEKPCIEEAVNVYGSFDTLDECKAFVQQHKNKVITEMYTVTNNKWTLFGPFKENRESVEFFNKNTQLLESIMKQREADSKLGSELLKKRVTKRKVRNVKQYGKDHPNFLKYAQQSNSGVYDSGISKIDVNEDGVTVEREMELSSTGAKVDEDGIPEDALEIGVTTVSIGENKVTQNKIYTEVVETTSPV